MGRCRVWWLALALAGCAPAEDKPGLDPDDTDTMAVHTDGSPDTDPADMDGGEVAVYDTVEPVVPFATLTFEGRQVVAHIPSDPAGLVFVFHGSGGDATLVENVEVTDILNRLLLAGVGFVAVDSDNRSNGVFNANAAPASNGDWQRLASMRDFLISDGQITATTPIFGWGYSAGGYFAGYFAHAALEAGWPMRGLSLHQATGRSGHFGDAPDVPIVFLPAQNDASVDPASVVDKYEDHLAAGHEGKLLWHRPRCLVPTRFARSPFIAVPRSEALYAQAVDLGLVQADGCADYGPTEVDAAVDGFADRPDVTPTKPVRAVLSVVFATHAVNGEHAAAEAAYLVQQLP